MKTLFIPAKSKSVVNKEKILEISKKLPKNIAITYSIQFQEVASEIKQILNKTHKVTKLTQVLGCSNPEFPKQTQAVLLVGQARFHATGLAISTNLPIYILEQNKLSKISESDIKQFKQKQKVSQMKFLHSDNVGILVSTKPGQQNLKRALELQNSDKLKNKKPYLYIANNISTQEFENFPQIQSWINTACPRMDMADNSIINIKDLE
jgi:2-(3-amino-3-carboxypropyl)histidine synthase